MRTYYIEMNAKETILYQFEMDTEDVNRFKMTKS